MKLIIILIIILGNTGIFTKRNPLVVRLRAIQVERESIFATAEGYENSGLYGRTQDSTKQCHTVSLSTHHANLLHHRLTHASDRVLKMVPGLTVGIESSTGRRSPCQPCKLGKALNKSFQPSFIPVSFAGEIVHSDFAGPLPVSTYGHQFFCTFLNQYSRSRMLRVSQLRKLLFQFLRHIRHCQISKFFFKTCCSSTYRWRHGIRTKYKHSQNLYSPSSFST